jgi:hypothetical protein
MANRRGPTLSDNKVEATTQAFLDSQEMDEVRAYIERGRSLEAEQAQALNRRWASAFTAVCAHGSQAFRLELDNCSAELNLRKMPKPDHLVQDVMRLIQARIKSLSPEHLEKLKESVSDFLDELGKATN